MDQSHIPVIEGELRRLRDGLFDAWKVYMSWYTWFFGANLIVLGWIFTQSPEPEPKNMKILAASWALFNLTGFIASLRVRSYTLWAKDRAEELCEKLKKEVQALQVSVEPTSGFPSELFSFGAAASSLSLAVNICLWGYLFAVAG